jgi:DNA-binding transcriptional regulator YiaG
MANIASVLKEEIARLSRKEVRADTEHLKKSSAKYRSEIAAMKRKIGELEPREEAVAPKGKVRFSAERFKLFRQRLGLSAQAMGALLEVSGQTIYSWESGKTRPSDKQLDKFAALRAKGKREILKSVQESETGSSSQ